MFFNLGYKHIRHSGILYNQFQEDFNSIMRTIIKIKLLLFIIFLTHKSTAQEAFCDSLFKIETQILARKIPVPLIESPPIPLIKKQQKESYFNIFMNRANCDSKLYKVYLEFIIDLDSLPKCIKVVKTENDSLDLEAVGKLKKIKYVPARKNGKAIPYFTFVMFKVYKD